MYILEILFAIFQMLPGSSKAESKESQGSSFLAVAVFAVILLVIILIWRYNPDPGAKALPENFNI